MTPQVELVYDMDCPNVPGAREVLLKAFVRAGLRPVWNEWDRKSPESAAYVRRYGSPTILVNGRDVGDADISGGADSCRIYDHGDDGVRGCPPVQAVATALVAGASVETKRNWWRVASAALGIGVTLLPVGGCPACWPAYSAILGALGAGWLLDSAYLVPVSAGLLGLALFALGYRAKKRRGFRPLALGALGVALILAFKFAYAFAPMVDAGFVFLLVASLWNAWPLRKGGGGSCPECARPGRNWNRRAH